MFRHWNTSGCPNPRRECPNQDSARVTVVSAFDPRCPKLNLLEPKGKAASANVLTRIAPGSAVSPSGMAAVQTGELEPQSSNTTGWNPSDPFVSVLRETRSSPAKNNVPRPRVLVMSRRQALPQASPLASLTRH